MPGKLLTHTLTRVLGSRNHHVLKRLGQVITSINELERTYEKFSDEELRNQTQVFRRQMAEGRSHEACLPEAFAAVREASKRHLGMRPFDVQLLGGLALTGRSVAEMRTGEGKSLTSTLPAYWRALAGKGVHVVTVNEYLAQRDAQIHAPLYDALGMKVGMIRSEQSTVAKREAYRADITYGTSSQFGFDYLRDNSSVYEVDDRVQRGHYYALLDEVDSILIDEARTPLVLSQGCGQGDSDLYRKIYPLMHRLTTQAKPDDETYTGEGDVFVDRKAGRAQLTERGFEKLEQWIEELGIVSPAHSSYDKSSGGLWYTIQACLSAHFLFHRDNQYIVNRDEAFIIDANTGRVSTGRRWVHGIHEAIEAKEGLTVRVEAPSSASVSYQNYFRIYENIAGMTGTADTEAFEFSDIYGMETVVIPTNRPMIRTDQGSRLTARQDQKWSAIIEDIESKLAQGRPVLVGTASIETSEHLSQLLQQRSIAHKVLNARYHEQEAEIIAQAGVPRKVTIATNMAGRGTDIILGGSLREALNSVPEAQLSPEVRSKIIQAWEARNTQVVEAGGLHVIGTEHFESRRIDNQLRGRAGRQGDPGSSCFYASLEDELFKKSYQPWVLEWLKRGVESEGKDGSVVLEGSSADSLIQQAQRLVENQNFDSRKQVLEYDNVVNEYRLAVYACRNLILEADELTSAWASGRKKSASRWVQRWMESHAKAYGTESVLRGLQGDLQMEFGLDAAPLLHHLLQNPLSRAETQRRVVDWMEMEWSRLFSSVQSQTFQTFLKHLLVSSLDEVWCEHLDYLDRLRNQVQCVGLAQQDPKIEHKKQAFLMFQRFFEHLDELATKRVSRYLVNHESHRPRGPRTPSSPWIESLIEPQPQEAVVGDALPQRNGPCPCGSGERYKRCHGAVQEPMALNDATKPLEAIAHLAKDEETPA